MNNSDYQQEAALRTYLHHQQQQQQLQLQQQQQQMQQMQQMNTTYPGFLVTNSLSYRQLPVTTSLNQQNCNTPSAGFQTMTPYNRQGPVMGTYSHPQQYYHAQYAGCPRRPAPVYQGHTKGSTSFWDPRNLNVRSPAAPSRHTSGYQVPIGGRPSGSRNLGLNRPVPAVTAAVTDNTASACINPALLMIHRTASPPRQVVNIDQSGSEYRSEVSTDRAPATFFPSPPSSKTEPHSSPPPPPPPELLKEATRPEEATSSTTTTATPPSTSPAVAPAKHVSFKRSYAWLQSTALLPEIPNSKKQKMSLQEGAYRQRYEMRAQNSTAAHFLGLKPVEGAPVVDWSKEILAPSFSPTSGESASSLTKKRGRKEGAENRTIGVERANNKAKVVAAPRKEQLKQKAREKKKAWRNGGEAADDAAAAAAAAMQAEADEDAVMARQIEAMFEEEEEKEEREKSEKEKDDEMAAEIEAMFMEEEEEKEREKSEKEENDEMAAEIEAMFDGEEGGEGDREAEENGEVEEQQEDNRSLEELRRYLLPAEEELSRGPVELIIEYPQPGRR